MSVQVMDKRGFEYLVEFAIRYGIGNVDVFRPGDACQMLHMLYKANLLAYNERYSEIGNYSEFEGWVKSWKPWYITHFFNPIQFIKTAQYLDYQCCGLVGWDGSEQQQLLKQIINHAITMLPGYNDAVWGVPENI